MSRSLLAERVLGLRRIGRARGVLAAMTAAQAIIESDRKDEPIPVLLVCHECRRTNAHNSRCSRRKA